MLIVGDERDLVNAQAGESKDEAQISALKDKIQKKWATIEAWVAAGVLTNRDLVNWSVKRWSSQRSMSSSRKNSSRTSKRYRSNSKESNNTKGQRKNKSRKRRL